MFAVRCSLLLLLSLLATVNLIIFESKFYIIEEASTVKPKDRYSYTNSETKTSIERIYQGDIPEDKGLDNYGDLVLNTDNNDYDWVTRDTVTNDIYHEDVVIRYERAFRHSMLTNLQVLNFGRQRGYCHSATINHEEKIVNAEILVKAGESVRILVEVYGRKAKKD